MNVDFQPPASEDGAAKPLTWRNWLNLGAFLLNFAVTQWSQTASFSKMVGPSNADISRKFTTLLTPAGYAFAIWGLIFLWEGVFAVGQLFLRESKVPHAVAPYWAAASLCQILWSFAFAKESMILACILIATNCFGILMCCYLGTLACGKKPTVKDWILLNCFSLHGGWLIAATIVNVNIVVVAQEGGPAAQLCVALLSFALLGATSTFHAVPNGFPNYILNGVLFWALIAVAVKLRNPTDLRDPTRVDYFDFPDWVIWGFRSGAVAVAVWCGLMVAAAAGSTVWAHYYPDGRDQPLLFGV